MAQKKIAPKKPAVVTKKKSPAKIVKKKSKPSTVKRYQARGEKREAWKKAHPKMVPGEIGKVAHPAATDAEVVAAVSEAPFAAQQEPEKKE
jgi:hypothetical protein